MVLNFLCFSAAMAGEILQENIPLERNGIQLHLERYAEQNGLEKKPLLLVHGVTYSSHEFDVDYGDYSLARYFARHGFEVWLLDIAGFGRSGEVTDGFLPDSDYAAEDIAAAVRCILARHNLPSMDVLGWSWGTVTSGRFAAKYPELVHRLVLYAPIVAGLGDVRVKEPFHKNTWEHAAWRYDKDSSPNGGRRDLLVSSKIRLIPTAEIKATVLIIAGANDPYVTPELCEEAYKTLPNKASQLEIIPGAAHAMLMERPYYKLFREKVMGFLLEGRND